MSAEEAKKLLGGYATGTLTPEEQQALFAAALEDQDLFDALAGEQALKEAFDDPGTRAELLEAVTGSRKSWWARWWPVPAGAGALALAALTVTLMVHREQPLATVAENRAAAPAMEAVPAAPPAAARQEKAVEKPADRRQMKAQPIAANEPIAQAEERMVESAKKAVADTATEAPLAQLAAPAAPPPAPAAARAPVAVAKESGSTISAAQRIFEAPPVTGDATTLGFRAAPGVGGAVMGTGGARMKAERADAVRGAVSALVPPMPAMKYTLAEGAITVEANFNGFVQAFRREKGEWVAAGSAVAVKAHEAATISRDAAAETVLVAAPRAVAVPGEGARLTMAVEALRVREPQLLKGAGGEAMYVAEPRAATDAMIVVTIGAGQK